MEKLEVEYKKHDEDILKDGHTMFLDDVVKDLNRKSFLQAENDKLRAENERLVEALEGMLAVFDRGLKDGMIGKRHCDDAHEVLNSLS